MHADLWTLLLQAINFLVLVWLLHRLLYKPVLALAAARRQEIEAAYVEAEQREKTAAAAQQTLDERMRDLHQERDRLLGEAHLDIAAEHERMCQQTRAQADAEAARVAEELARERAAAADSLQYEAARLAVQMARDLLRESGGPSLDAGLAARACERLEGLDDRTLNGLLGDSPDPLALRLLSAAPLEAAERSAVEQRLAARLARPLALVFDVDPALLGGVELELPHGSVSVNWRDSLQRAAAELESDAEAR